MVIMQGKGYRFMIMQNNPDLHILPLLDPGRVSQKRKLTEREKTPPFNLNYLA